MTKTNLRVGVAGAGGMGADHISRITNRIGGATVSAIVEPDINRAMSARANAPHAEIFERIEDAIGSDSLDALIIATPGRFHEVVLVPALESRIPILCEKPLTNDSASAETILTLEQKLDKPHIQVGFMRRFDREYQDLQKLISVGSLGDLLMLRCIHRNPSVLDGYIQEMLINDSVVHEFDIVPWLASSPLKTVEVKFPRRNKQSPAHLREPILVLMELANGVLVDVEMNVSVQFGYQVATEAVFEKGIARIGQPSGLQRWHDGEFSMKEHASNITRFTDAYDLEVQSWVDAVTTGTLVGGPNSWDGYMTVKACEAGVKALSGGVIPVELLDRPKFYS